MWARQGQGQDGGEASELRVCGDAQLNVPDLHTRTKDEMREFAAAHFVVHADEGLHGRRYEATLWAAACAPGSNRHRPARYPKELPAQARLRAVRTALLGVHARVCV